MEEQPAPPAPEVPTVTSDVQNEEVAAAVPPEVPTVGDVQDASPTQETAAPTVGDVQGAPLTQVTVTSPTLPHITSAEDAVDANKAAEPEAEQGAEGDPRQRKSSTSSTSSLGGAWGGLGPAWWDPERSRSVTPSGGGGAGGVHCLDVPPTGGWAARRWSGGESPSPRGALSPLLELRRPHCTLQCATCNAILEEKYKHTRSRRASFVKEADIVQSMKEGGRPLFRPGVDQLSCEDEVMNLMRRCWAEDPAERPDFSVLKQTIRRLNQ
ncbi:uncharacterized protein LOC127749722 [Frankliniella occidentalis]|uniref:Uncharacterized protein LOC127749722 n=1 Tax=Frankliniella occidentalis TaxID=133901 RepID=A0A9C6UAM1_FRAOC|nr:uncharacterized protein LOC127749722 [Frankliniella occidentalis]